MATYKEEETKLVEYLMKYGDYYDDVQKEFLISNFFKPELKKAPTIESVRSYLGLIPDEEDSYIGYFEFLKANFDLGVNIGEIGAGTMPVLAKYIDEYQQEIKRGTIEVYEPLLAPKHLGNVILSKRLFNGETKDLYIARAICETSEVIIETANKENKPFSVMMCSCIPKGYPSYDEWVYGLLDTAEKGSSDEFDIQIKYLNENYKDSHPVITKTYKNKVTY